MYSENAEGYRRRRYSLDVLDATPFSEFARRFKRIRQSLNKDGKEWPILFADLIRLLVSPKPDKRDWALRLWADMKQEAETIEAGDLSSATDLTNGCIGDVRGTIIAHDSPYPQGHLNRHSFVPRRTGVMAAKSGGHLRPSPWSDKALDEGRFSLDALLRMFFAMRTIIIPNPIHAKGYPAQYHAEKQHHRDVTARSRDRLTARDLVPELFPPGRRVPYETRYQHSQRFCGCPECDLQGQVLVLLVFVMQDLPTFRGTGTPKADRIENEARQLIRLGELANEVNFWRCLARWQTEDQATNFYTLEYDAANALVLDFEQDRAHWYSLLEKLEQGFKTALRNAPRGQINVDVPQRRKLSETVAWHDARAL